MDKDLGEAMPTMESEAAGRLLKKMTTVPTDVPSRIRKIIGQENLRAYLEVIYNPDVAEPDWYYKTGQMAKPAIDQYVALAGITSLARQKLFTLAEKMVKDLAAEKKSSVSKQPTSSLIEKLMVDANRMAQGKGPDDGGLATVINCVQNLYKHIAELKEGEFSRRGDLVTYFQETFLALLSIEFGKILNSASAPHESKKCAGIFLSKLRENANNNGRVFIGDTLEQEIDIQKKTLGQPQFRKNLDEMISYRELSEEERRDLKKEIDEMLAAVVEEASYKKIYPTTSGESGRQISFFSHDIGDKTYFRDLCIVRANFSPYNVLENPRSVPDEKGDDAFSFRQCEGMIAVRIDRVIGELSLITVSNYNLDRIMDQDRYLQFKRYILNKIHDYLQAKDQDMLDHFLPEARKSGEEEIEDKINKERQDFANVLNPGDEDAAEVLDDEEDQQKQAGTQDAIIDTTQVFQSPKISKHEQYEITKKISTCNTGEVLAALARMGIEEIKGHGKNHPMFKGTRNNLALPMPKHGTIAPPLVWGNLEKWGYTAEEYAISLGLKIRRKKR